MAAAMPAPGEVDQLAVGVELSLNGGIVAGVDRGRAPVALEPVERHRDNPPLAARAVQNLKVLRMARGRAHDEGAEGIRLFDRAQLRECPGAEARVPHPGVA